MKSSFSANNKVQVAFQKAAEVIDDYKKQKILPSLGFGTKRELSEYFDKLNKHHDFELVVEGQDPLATTIKEFYDKICDSAEKRRYLGIGSENIRKSLKMELSEQKATFILLLIEFLLGVRLIRDGDEKPNLKKKSYKFEKHNVNIDRLKDIRLVSKGPSELTKDLKATIDDGTEWYVCHYIRANHPESKKPYNNPGYGILSLNRETKAEKHHSAPKRRKHHDTDQQHRRQAQLQIDYLNETVIMRGDYIKSGSTIFVRASGLVKNKPIETQLSLVLNSGEIETLIGTYSSIRRGVFKGTHGAPICGTLFCIRGGADTEKLGPKEAIELLKKVEQFEKDGASLYRDSASILKGEKSFLENTWAIRYFLGDRRYSALPGGELKSGDNLLGIPGNLLNAWKTKVYDTYCGYYVGYYLKTPETGLSAGNVSTFEEFYMVIREDGRASMKVVNNYDNSIYHGYIRVVSDRYRLGSVLGYFDYQAAYDYYRFEVFFNDYDDKEGEKYLVGSFGGFEHKKAEVENPISGRMILKQKSPKEFSIHNAEPKSYPLTLEANGQHFADVLAIFSNDKVLSRFFLTETPYFRNMTDAAAWQHFTRLAEYDSPTPNAQQLFRKFNKEGYTTFTYFDAGGGVENHKIERAHLSIDLKGGAEYYINNEVRINGRCHVLGEMLCVELKHNDSTPTAIYLIINLRFRMNNSLLKLEDNGLKRLYGIQLINTNVKVEARTMVLCANSTDSPLNGFVEEIDVSKLAYINRKSGAVRLLERRSIKERLRTLDKSYQGAISYLMGSSNRYLKTNQHVNVPFEPRTRYERQVNYLAACRIAELYKIESEDLKRELLFDDFKIHIRKAYIHGFAAETFGGDSIEEAMDKYDYETEKEVFLKLRELITDRQLLEKEVTSGCLSETIFADEVKQLWDYWETPSRKQ